MFLNDAATTGIYTLSLHNALPIFEQRGVGRGDVAAGGADHVQVRVLGGVVDRRPLAQVRVPDQAEPLEQLEGPVDRRRVGDRKSTRLNSSHVNISYAVFCLKKTSI